MATTDLTAVVVAVVGVAGTMGAPLLAQRARRAETADQAAQADRERRENREEVAFHSKRELYAALNSAARAYRIAAQDETLALRRGDSVDPSNLDAARAAYNEQYAGSQMVLPDRPLKVASEVNRCLGLGYKLARQLPTSPDRATAFGQALGWYKGPLSDGVWLLRHALREDLGVIPEFPDLLPLTTRLRSQRQQLGSELDAAPDRELP